MILIGITGGIASGKTEVAKVFQRLGAKILSGDEIGKDVVEKNPELLKKLVKTFCYMYAGDFISFEETQTF